MSKNLVVDTNLLLLWIIGSIDSGRHIASSKKLKDYNYEDFISVNTLIGTYDVLCITPYIATEISNMISFHGNIQSQAYEIFQALLKNEEKIKIINTDLQLDIDGKSFCIFGLTDNSLIKLVNDYCILTADNKLCSALYRINDKNVLQYSLVKLG